MKLRDIITEVLIDNTKGIGCVPYNQDIGYFGAQVMMRPSTFLQLATHLDRQDATSSVGIENYIRNGGAIASPWVKIKVPTDWNNNIFTQHAAIVGHEGRNRMYAILNVDGDRPVEVHLVFVGDKKEWRARDLTPEMMAAVNSGLVNEDKTRVIRGPLFK